MHSDIIKSVSRLITERKHTISSALVWSAQQATSDFLLFLSLLPPEVNIGKPNPPPSLHTYEHTNTTCDCFLPAGAAGNSWEIGDGSEMCTAVWREFKHGNQCKGGGGDTVMCVCVCGRRKGVGHLQTTPTSPYLQRGGLCSQRLNTFSERR